MSNARWSKFFWNDWRGDPALRLCSLAAQGLWMQMLCIAAEADPIGYVTVAGQPLDVRALARLTGEETHVIETLLAELRSHGVFSVTRNGFVYNRRMVRDDKRARDGAYCATHGEISTSRRGRKALDNKQENIPPPIPPPRALPEARKKEGSDSSLRSESAGEVPADDPVKAVFDAGVRILTSRGIPEKQARSEVGKHRKTLHDDGRLLAILLSVERNNAVEPLAYLEQAVRRAGNGFALVPGVG